MSPAPARDPVDAQRARGARGLLRDFNHLGVLGAADVHVAARLGHLGGERDEAVLLGVALAVRALRSGSVCLDLASARESTSVEEVDPEELAALAWPDPLSWADALAASPLVTVGEGGPDERPLRLRDGALYLDRYWRQEQRIARVLDEAALRPPPPADEQRLATALERLFPPGEAPAADDRQRLAAVLAVRRWVSVLAGGPGTGKTTTVARLLALLQDQAGGSLRVALAAPTAVAAVRLTDAVRGVSRSFAPDDRDRVGDLEASTLHRLLGFRPGSRTRFLHDHDNRLPVDLVVVDEASMVSLTLMSRLVDALPPQARLVLVGDPDQLASVEAGAVLGDLVERDPPPEAPSAAQLTGLVAGLAGPDRVAARRGVVRLSTVHRFSAEIQSLAEAVRAGDPQRVLDVLDRGLPGVELVEPGSAPRDLESLREDVVSTGRLLDREARAGHGEQALLALVRHRVLCAHRSGPFGVARWSGQVEQWLREAVPGFAAATSPGGWYVARPVLVTSNDYHLRLFNGDTGVVVATGSGPRVAVHRGGRVDLLAPSRLGEVATLHAMSVHRSQGSQFDRVTLVLPPTGSPLLTRELLYTGLTRAKQHVRIVGGRDAIAAAVSRPIVRASGLRARR